MLDSRMVARYTFKTVELFTVFLLVLHRSGTGILDVHLNTAGSPSFSLKFLGDTVMVRGFSKPRLGETSVKLESKGHNHMQHLQF